MWEPISNRGRPVPLRTLFFILLQVLASQSLGIAGTKVKHGGLKHKTLHGSSSLRANYVSDVANGFNALLQQLQARDALRDRADTAEGGEQLRLVEKVIQTAKSRQDKAALEDALEMEEESRMEKENAQGEVASFVSTLKAAMGYQGGAASCRELVCGGHAFYTNRTLMGGVSCRCEAGYEGDGIVCNPPTSFTERPLIYTGAGASPVQAVDLHVSTLRDNTVAVTFRDVARNSQGFVILGQASAGGMRWGKPVLISESSPAYSPVLVELMGSEGLAVAFRTKNRGGEGVLLCGRRDLDGGIKFGPPRAFTRLQAQQTSLIALPDSRVALLFAEHLPRAPENETMDMYGGSLLARLSPGVTGSLPGVPQLLGKTHFAHGAVSRISVAALSPKQFVVAYRQASPDADGSSAGSLDASVSLAELWGSELVFTTKAVSLEPDQSQIWARSVAGLGNNAFAYTYHSGTEKVTKQAVLQLDPGTHQLSVIEGPTVISSGFTPFVSSVSTVAQREDQQTSSQLALLQSHGHRFFTFLGGQGSGARGQGRLCTVSQDGLPTVCRELLGCSYPEAPLLKKTKSNIEKKAYIDNYRIPLLPSGVR
ncbi:unnamed protein product [Polarella glacialis]|uniref:EGF-like domain-containing protein n=1 Tax=Polarella glacialis TaxID=89957 RepID=A0A813DDU5_POLGL|nr:unnamed protein product [Polarella glacialis]